MTRTLNTATGLYENDPIKDYRVKTVQIAPTEEVTNLKSYIRKLEGKLISISRCTAEEAVQAILRA